MLTQLSPKCRNNQQSLNKAKMLVGLGPAVCCGTEALLSRDRPLLDNGVPLYITSNTDPVDLIKQNTGLDGTETYA